MGDHEIGDFGHNGHIAPDRFKARAHWAWVKTWTQVFGHAPHYHVSLAGGVGLWTLQPFRRDAGGGIRAAIGPKQRTWLAKSLDASPDRWKLVQTEIPPYASAGFTGRGTSGTLLHNADQLYRLMARHGVDLVLGAEFHDVDALQRRGLPEIIHGGALAGGSVSYLTIKVYRQTLRVTVSRMAHATVDTSETLWCPSTRLRVPAHIALTPGATVTGHMEITHAGATYADGDLTLR